MMLAEVAVKMPCCWAATRGSNAPLRSLAPSRPPATSTGLQRVEGSGAPDTIVPILSEPSIVASRRVGRASSRMSTATPPRRSGTRTLLVIVLPSAVLVTVLVAALAFWFLLARHLRPLDTGPIDDRCIALRHGMVNSFVYARGGTVIAIDTGTDATRTEAEYRKAGLDAGSIEAVFLTHADPDHAGGVALFHPAVLYMGEAEAESISGTRPRRILGLLFRTTFDRPWTAVRHESVVTIGAIRVVALHVPGHSPGSTSYLVDATHLFTGDLMMLSDGRAVVSASVINNDSAESARSLRALARRVSGTGLSLIATAHSGVSRDPDTALSSWR
jgi:hydroxyacylglutathione hydrolase